MVGWCMHCHGPSDLTISFAGERAIAHYAACWDHLEEVCAWARHYHSQPRSAALPPVNDAIDVTSQNVAGELTP